MSPGVAREGYDVNRTRSEMPVRSVGSFNPTLAIVVSSMIMTFFLVGFATGYFKRWLLGIEAAESEEFRQRQLRMMMMHNSRSKPEEDGGLDAEVVNSLPLLQYADYMKQQGVGDPSPEDCPVCLSVFEGSDRVRVLPICKHSFHSDCIDAWFQLHSTCPVCRASLQPDRGHGGPPALEVVIHDSRRAVPGLSQQGKPRIPTKIALFFDISRSVSDLVIDSSSNL